MNMDTKIRDEFRNFLQVYNPGLVSVFDAQMKATGNYINPTIIEEREMHVTQMDVFSRLMMERQVYFGNVVNQDTCNITIAQLLYLDSVSHDDITMYINSPGGNVIDGFGLKTLWV